MTVAETILWTRLSNKKLNGYKFRRQHPVYHYIADFYCHELKLVIELDGKIHNPIENKDYDNGREVMLKELGLYILRYKNEEILENIEMVIDKLKASIKEICITSNNP